MAPLLLANVALVTSLRLQERKGCLSDNVESILEQEREKLRQVIGAIGGRTTRRMKIINLVFVLAVVTAFLLALFTHSTFRTAALEIGLLLLSLKFAVLLHNEARVNHFQF